MRELDLLCFRDVAAVDYQLGIHSSPINCIPAVDHFTGKVIPIIGLFRQVPVLE